MAHGYYTSPALHGRTLVFVSEDDLFIVDSLPKQLLENGGGDDDGSMDSRPLIASRLTTCSARDGLRASNPCISPCGKWVAYVCGSDERGDDVWIVPTQGGATEQLTFEGVPADKQRGLAVRGWSPDGTQVLYATPSFSTLPDQQLALVTAFGSRRGESAVLPLAQASDGVLFTRRPRLPPPPHEGLPNSTAKRQDGDGADAGPLPDSGTLLFVRLPHQGCAIRGYAGGFVQQLWTWRVPLSGGGGRGGSAHRLADDDEAAALGPRPIRPICADHAGPAFNPMYHAGSDRIFFLTDRPPPEEVGEGSRAQGAAAPASATELWSSLPEGRDLRCHTRLGALGHDARSASLYGDLVVVEAGAELFLVDISDSSSPAGSSSARAGAARPLPLRLRSSRERTLPYTLTPSDALAQLQHTSLAPDGDSAVLVVRGKAFVVPKNGAASNGASLGRVGRVVEASRVRGLRVRSAEFAWGDGGVGNWLCCVASEDGRGGSAVAAQLAALATVSETGAAQSVHHRHHAHGLGAFADDDAVEVAATESTRGALTFVTTVDTTCGCLAVSLSDHAPGLNPLRTYPRVTEVEPCGCLGRAGILRGDLLVEVNGSSVSSHASAMPMLERKGVHTVKVQRPAGPHYASFTAAASSSSSSSSSSSYSSSFEDAAVAVGPSPASEMRLWHLSLNGTTAPKPLTSPPQTTGDDVSGGAGGAAEPMILRAIPSPNGLKVAYVDSEARLFLLHCRTGSVSLVMQGREGIGTAFAWNKPFEGLCWSPCGEWLAFACCSANSMPRVFVVATGGPHATPAGPPIPLTSDRFPSWSPSWSVDGKWLYFLSERHLTHSQDVFGLRAEQPNTERSVGIYAIPRDPSMPKPWTFGNELIDEDLLRRRSANGEREGGGGGAGPDATPRTGVSHGMPLSGDGEHDGDDGSVMGGRGAFPGWGYAGGPAEAAGAVERVPVPPSAFRRIACACRGRLLLLNAFNDELQVVDVPLAAKHGDHEAKALIDGISPDFVVSPNGERVLLRRLGRMYVGEVDWGLGGRLALELGEAQALRTTDLQVCAMPPALPANFPLRACARACVCVPSRFLRSPLPLRSPRLFCRCA
jgi:tricorn protease-like protein